MCGRYVARIDAAVELHWALVVPWQRSYASYNVAPGQDVPAVQACEAGRAGVFLRWGLVPFWAKGEAPRYSTINARAETLASAATYRGPWVRGQRCLLPALGFYEWQAVPGGKQPYFIRLAGGEPFALAGLWERSRKPGEPAVHSCTIITVEANALVAEIHDKRRMPAIVTADRASAWLEGTREQAGAELTPYPAERMEAYPVSRRVNAPRNDDPELIEPLAADREAGM